MSCFQSSGQWRNALLRSPARRNVFALRSVVTAALLCITLTGLHGQDDALELLRLAKNRFDAHLTDEGLALIDKALGINPDLAEAYHLRARVYINNREFQKAVNDCTRLIALRPDAGEGYILRGFAYLSLSEEEKAVVDLSRAIEIWPGVVDGYMMRAIAYANLKDFENSSRDCTKAIALAPDMPFLYLTRATSELWLHQYDDALADLQKVLTLDPQRSDVFLLVGIAHAGKNELDTALAWTEKAVHDTGTAATAYRNLGFLYLAKGDPDSSISCFMRAMERDTTRDRCRAMLGMSAAFIDEQKPEEARSWLKRAKSIEPKLQMDKDVLVGFEHELLFDTERRAYARALGAS
jgi:tetratricopeptide (TPR) repeat protein